MKSWVWNLFVATNQWLRRVLTASFFSATLLLFKTRTSWFFLFFSFFTIPFCFDGLAMLEQGLHALSLRVSLLAGLLFFAWLLFSLGLTACSCEKYYLLRLNFLQASKLQPIKDALTFIHDWRRDCRPEWWFCPQGRSVACGWDRVICLLVFHFFVLEFLVKSHKSVTGPVQRPRKRHFTPLGRNLLTASASSRQSTQPPCQSPSWGAKSGEHNDMLIRWTCRNTHLTLDPPDNNHNYVTEQFLFILLHTLKDFWSV